MSESLAVPALPAARTRSAAAAVPWYIWCTVAAVTSAIIGGHWDISWHRTIGRDTFWTPAHVAIYLCGILAGLSSGYLILAATLQRGLTALRDASVTIWGFRGPLGAFITAWGGVAMIVSAPFDDWWHAAYGLDIKIISPPHAVLFTGVLAVHLGTLILILGRMNSAEGRLRGRLESAFLYVAGISLTTVMVVLLEQIIRILQHSSAFYQVVCAAVPLMLLGAAGASSHRWAATILAGIYTAIGVLLVWVLPLFPAEPKLGPVFRPTTHFVPPEFPVLIVVPALVLDLLRRRTAALHPWLQALRLGAAFLGAFFVVQWPFADFLMSEASRNAVFGTQYLSYNTPPTSYQALNRFYPADATIGAFLAGMSWALVLAVVSARVGLAWAAWMRRVRR